jgi:putative NADPH-quinone reductase
MKILAVYAHPWEGSYNHAILEAVKRGAKRAGHSLDVIDLNKEGYNPVFSEKGLSLYNKGKFADPKVGEYQKRIEDTDYLVFVFPIWWGDMPAILKGFSDKVFLPGWAYTPHPSGLLFGKLRHIKGATVINTMGGPVVYQRFFLRAPVKRAFINNTLKNCGIKRVKLFEFGRVAKVDNKKREKWLSMVENRIAALK